MDNFFLEPIVIGDVKFDIEGDSMPSFSRPVSCFLAMHGS